MEPHTIVALLPAAEQIPALLAGPDGPVVMLNLLRFKPRGDAPDDDVSGEEAYRRYGDPMMDFVRSKGGRIIWFGRIDSQVIGHGGEGFHMAALVEYPSRKAFVEIATDPHVHALAVHRTAGLEGQWLLATTTELEG